MNPGLSNLGRVEETLTEDNVPGEGTIYYDIRFTAYHKGMIEWVRKYRESNGMS